MPSRHHPLPRSARPAVARPRAPSGRGAARHAAAARTSARLHARAALRRRRAEDTAGVGEDFYRARGIDIVDTDRGGRVTYHGPGQLVGYPIMRIARHRLPPAHDGIGDRRRARRLRHRSARSRCAEGPDYTGVWVEDRKIASIGVHVSRGDHHPRIRGQRDHDLDPFSWIVACGLPGVTMTSIARELPPGRTVDPDALRTRMAQHFCAGPRPSPRPATRALRRSPALRARCASQQERHASTASTSHRAG